MKKIFIRGNYGYGNIADDAILETLLRDINKIIKDKKLIISCTNANKVNINKNLKSKIELINNYEGIIPFKSIKKINSADIFILGGSPQLTETFLFEFGPLQDLLYLLVPLLLGKKVFLWGIEFGPINNYFLKFLTKIILSKVSAISVRDNKSYQRLKKIGLKCPIFRSIDPVLNLKSKKNYELLKKYGLNNKLHKIYIFPRKRCKEPVYFNLKQERVILKENIKKDEQKFEKIAKVIDRLQERTNTKIVLMSEEFFESYFMSDKSAIDAILSKTKNKDKILVIDEEVTPEEFKSLISNASLIISERLHPLVMTRDKHIPAIAIGGIYNKIEEFMKDIKQEDKIINLFEKDIEKNIGKINLVYNEKDKIKQKLKKDYPRLIELSKNNCDILCLIKNLKVKNTYKNYFKKFVLFGIFLLSFPLLNILKILPYVKLRLLGKKFIKT